MNITAKLNNLRISPRKVRLLADMVRRKTAAEAKAFLAFSVKKGALPLEKLLDSAIANAQDTFHLKENDLFIAGIKVDGGRKLKRWRARARGRACRIEKKTSNITLLLKTVENKLEQPNEKLKKKNK